MTKLIKITDMSGETTEIKCNDTEELIKNMAISIGYYDLFYAGEDEDNDVGEECHITKSKRILDAFELEDDMELMIIKSDTPMRILDETVIKKVLWNDEECWDIEKMEKKFGPIEEWDVSFVSNMVGVFKDASSFNQDISKWDVSFVSDMSEIFWRASSFNQDISDWDTSNVGNMRLIFCSATSFNQDISGWKVNRVEDMSSMFHNASSFNQDISGWDTRNVEEMSSMFWRASSFNQDISDWDTSNVKDMCGMFSVASSFNQDISGWDVRNVKDMSDMFHNATSFNQDISNWDVRNVKDMSSMFHYASSFNQDISGWDVRNVSCMWDMFDSATSFEEPNARFYDFKRCAKRDKKLTKEGVLREMYTRRSFTKANLYVKLTEYGIKYKTKMKKAELVDMVVEYELKM